MEPIVAWPTLLFVLHISLFRFEFQIKQFVSKVFVFIVYYVHVEFQRVESTLWWPPLWSHIIVFLWEVHL